jgi:hypothetical protein
MLAGILLVFLFQREATHQSKEFVSSSGMASGKGISFFESHGEKKVYRVSIDNFSVEGARLGPFAIGPLVVAHLNKVTVDLYLEGIESGLGRLTERASLDFERPISNIRKNLPSRIKTIKLDNISINLWKSEKRIFRISSDTATVDRKTGEIIFTGHANMDAGENGNLISHRIRWDKDTGLFKVIDPYILVKNGKKIEGKGIETDYLLNKITKVAS